MSTLASLLHGTRAHGAFFHRFVLSPPWSLRFADLPPLTLVAMEQGQCWIVPDDSPPVLLRPRAVAVVVGPGHYTLADSPDSPPELLTHDGERCTGPNGADADDLRLSTRTCGRNPEGRDTLLRAAYRPHTTIGRRLLDVLPRVVLVPAETFPFSLPDLLSSEVTKNARHQQVVLDRLLDLLMTSILREWFDSSGPDGAGATALAEDPLVNRALRLLHSDPAFPWTVQQLADNAGVSRAWFARRFAQQMGEPPMTYLTRLRISLTADLLRSSDATLEGIARQVGYANAAALSTAFKRICGMWPSAYRLAGSQEAGGGAGDG